MKGGGDAISAARAVLQTGEYDFAWNLQVEDEVLKRLEKGGKGHRSHRRPAATSSIIQLNITDPWTEVDGERASLKTKHSTCRDPAVREALSLLLDRRASSGVHLRPHRHRDRATSSTTRRSSARKNTKCEFNIDKANAMLDEAGWKQGSDGIREKDGKKLKFVFQTSINQPRQKDAGDRQAGLPEGRHRDRAEVGDGLGVLLVRRRQPRHLSASSMPTCRCTRRP